VKLYTEEQVIKMIEKSRETGLTAEFLILATTSIELPSDGEIEKESFNLYANHNTYSLQVRQYKAFKRGATWMRDKIQGDQQ
jgi:hypothetical protein